MAGKAASAVQLVITAQEQTVEVQAVSLGVSVKAVIGEPEREVVNSLPGVAGGSGCFQDAVGGEHGTAVGR